MAALFRARYGSHAGWAHCLLFAAELPAFASLLGAVNPAGGSPQRKRKAAKVADAEAAASKVAAAAEAAAEAAAVPQAGAEAAPTKGAAELQAKPLPQAVAASGGVPLQTRVKRQKK